ncbi:hypothetical protein SAMN05216214_11030 [Atopomonas hussainii]|uniref:NlpC/P60 domain-containing protein n=1 Tax=Atopomonas hussainii TaxID=1429083 RepID=A0A1H7NW51_9GAMM|nr:hypothetical protein [Atopomonas hussainii]SEL27484.1 hypothetical protein SAMN05216214_11030 [Atopomonas hussainii]
MSTGLLEQRANYTAANYEYGYGSGGSNDVDKDNRKEIDCSHLLHKMLHGAGYNIPYQTTAQLNSSIYFEEIAEEDVLGGDIALWRTENHKHTGVVESFFPATGKGTFYGSQTSTGPASAKFGSGYWPIPTKFLRPKLQYKTGGAAPLQPRATPEQIDNGRPYQLPIRKADGNHYQLEEFYKALEKESSGHYLLGNHGFWHGGIHFSELSAPQCTLKQAIRCMADGEVVAYRLNKEYLTSTFEGETECSNLRYSTSFCLVRHTYESAKRPSEKKPAATTEWVGKTVQLTTSRNGRDVANTTLGSTGDFEALMPVGTELQIIKTHDTKDMRFALAKIKAALPGRDRSGNPVTRAATSEIWFAALDKRGSVLKGKDKKDIFKEVPLAPQAAGKQEPAKPETNKLSFFSLYMHLLPFEQYPLQAGEYHTRLRIKAKNRNVRKEANLTATPLGQIDLGAEVEVISITPNHPMKPGDTTTYELAQIKILSKGVRKAGVQTAKVGDLVWMAISKSEANNETERYVEEIPQQQRVRPSYWKGKVKARLKKRVPAFSTPEASTDKRMGQLAESSVLEYASDAVKRVQRDGRQQLMAPCTLVSGGFWDTPICPAGPIWVALDANSTELIPDDPCDFDSVVTCAIPIKAGDPIGYMGLYETLASPKGGVKSKHQVHIELFSTDPGLETFLKNPAGLKDGKQYLRVAKGKVIYNKSGTDAAPAFTPSGQVVNENYVINPNQAKLLKAPDKKEWYHIKVTSAGATVDGYIAKQDAEMICQHDREKLGFQIVKENNGNADGFLDPEATPDFYQALYKKVDALGNKDGKVTPDEIASALKTPKLRDRWSKLIGYHPTEWQAKSSEAKWQPLTELLKYSPDVLRHEQERIDNLVFWDELAGAMQVSLPKQVHHLHPIEFIGSLTLQKTELDSIIRKIGDIISHGEGNYESYNTGTKNVPGGKVGFSFINPPAGTVTGKTINSIISTENLAGTDRGRMFATGKYQTIISTLNSAKRKMHLTGEELYDGEMQERVFREYLIDKAGGGSLSRFVKNGEGSIDDAQYAAAKEWASIAAPAGMKIKDGRTSDGTLSYHESRANTANMKSTTLLRDALREANQCQWDQ